MRKLHPSVTPERLIEAAEESMFGMGGNGICRACGEDAYQVEPDARRYECECCGEREVYGAEELLVMEG